MTLVRSGQRSSRYRLSWTEDAWKFVSMCELSEV